MQIYTVKQGDTIDRIAGAAGMDPLRLAHDNQIEPPYRLAVGQSLLVACGDSEEAASGWAASALAMSKPVPS